jgi:2-dehydro-3-deoxyphosphogluconate aldolase/(4S)-4-hydroxy-2-oxoglutarate aldolase
MANNALDIVLESRLVAVIRLNNLDDFESLANTLLEGGIRVLEFTLTNLDALSAVESLRQSHSAFTDGTATIGIGSIRNLEQTRDAIDAGAQFLVSPILLHDMISYCQAQDVVAIPGAYSPTEIASAASSGAPLVKVFPANMLGPTYIKSILAPMPDLRLVPTGGVGLNNVESYLKAGCVAVGVGNSLVNPRLIANKDWAALRDLARQYCDAAAIDV